VTAGVGVIETTYNKQTQQWHLHLHLIIDGSFFPQKLLSKAWLEVTGDSPICDIRPVPDRRKAVAYMAEYVAKPVELHTWDDDVICEFADAMHGVRMVMTFGKAHKATVESAEPESESKATTFVTHTLTLKRLERAGNAKAEFALNTLKAWNRNVCESLGEEWKPPENGTRLVSELDVRKALLICEELERGLLVDRVVDTEPSESEMRQAGLFTINAI